MTTPNDNPQNLTINGLAVEGRLLESRPVRRCDLAECQAHCCSCGVYLNLEDAKKILDHQQIIFPHLPPERRNPEKWFDSTMEPDHDHPSGGMLTGTNVVRDPTHPAGQTCVFLRPDRKCALQVASIAAGERPWHLKPFYCALFPLVFHQRELILDDENEVFLEGGSCIRPSAGEPIPMFRLFEMEMKLAMGDAGYKELETRVPTVPSRPDTASMP
jgi:hypothetical protein